MYVVKRDGRLEEVSFDKVLNRIKKLSNGLEHVNPTVVAQKVCSQIKDKIHTSELDEFLDRDVCNDGQSFASQLCNFSRAYSYRQSS